MRRGLRWSLAAPLARFTQDMAEITPPAATAPALKKLEPDAGAMAGEQAQRGIRACQEGENDHAQVVLVFDPEGTSLMMGGLHPRVHTP